MQRHNVKKNRLVYDHTLYERPTTTTRTAVVRDVTISTRGYAVEERSLPITSRWTNWEVTDDVEFGLDGPDENWEDTGELPDHATDTTPVDNGKRKRSKTATRPSIVWRQNYCSTYLDELLRWEGTGGLSNGPCADCRMTGAQYRCDECSDPAMVCQACCLRRHRHNPYHMIKSFENGFFRKVGLKELGLVIQLGHLAGVCISPVPAHVDFTVLHTTGQHPVSLMFCGCSRAHPHHIQLLRHRLYPATQAQPKTCATFTLLDFLHVLSLSTQGSMQDMYRTLVRLNDNAGLIGLRSCYKQLGRMSHQYRHLKLLKRRGRGHINGGVNNVSPGDLALQCPTCPHKHTLPKGWEDLPKEEQYRNRFTEAVDGGFKLKNIFSSSWDADPGFGNGMAYMLPNDELTQYLAANTKKIDEVSSCVDFDAIKRASTKNGVAGGTGSLKPKYRVTGVVGASCARSEMLTPNGVGDLQYGERYVNVDLVVGYSLRAFAFLSVLCISYDIVCQWLVNLWKRMEDWPEHLKLNPLTTRVKGYVPKFHFHAHEAQGHSQFSLHRVPGSAQIDGECCERIWDGTNALGKTTRTMGPGMRSDTLDDHFGFWNWRKYIGIGKSIKQRYRLAIFMRNNMKEAHEGFTANMDAENVAKWTAEILAWETTIETLQPKNLKSPYDSDEAVLSDTRLRRLMDAEEEQAVKHGAERVHSIGPARFIMKGLDIEETQRRLASEIEKKTASTSSQHASILERRNALTLRIESYMVLRSTYLPGLPLHFERLSKQERASAPILQDLGTSNDAALIDSSSGNFPEDIPLLLPSSIPASYRMNVCATEAIHAEARLRRTQMTDSLNHQISGQSQGTRSRVIVDRMQERLDYYRKKYCVARAALLCLDSTPEWQLIWRDLKQTDMTSYADTEISLADAEKCRRRGIDPTKAGETRRILSWIWVSNAGVDELEEVHHTGLEGMDETLKVEWLKSRRRVGGWTEECGLLSAEMARCVLFLEAESVLWRSRQMLRSTPSSSLNEGIRAYALRQAALQEALLSNFAQDFDQALQLDNGKASKFIRATALDDDDYTPEDDEIVDII